MLVENGFSASVLNPKNKRITPTLKIADDFISNNPKLILYGVGFRDIGFTDKNYCKLSQIPPYSLSKSMTSPKILDTPDKEKFPDIRIFSQNPKYVTLDILESILGKQKIQYVNNHGIEEKNIELGVFEYNEIRNIEIVSTYCLTMISYII